MGDDIMTEKDASPDLATAMELAEERMADDKPQDDAPDEDAADASEADDKGQVEEEETEEQETEDDKPAVPELIKKYNPGMAAQWSKLDKHVQQTLIEDIALRLDSARQPAGDAGKEGEKAADRGDQPEAGEETERAAEFTGANLPEPLSDADREALMEYFDEDTPAGRAIGRLIERDNQLLQYIGDILEDVNKAFDGFDNRLSSIAQERKLEQALDTYADDLKDFDQSEYESISQKALEMVSSGRFAQYDDAVFMAITEARKQKPNASKANPEQTGSKRRRAQLARSAAGSSRRLGKGQQRVPQSLEEARELALERMRGT